MKVLLAKTLVQIDKNYGPLFFIAGPVRGGGDWQKTCCEEIEKHTKNFYAAIPWRYSEDHPLFKLKVAGEEGKFDRQTAWERYYLQLAAETGCLIFWLANESKTEPRKPEDGPYARETLGEIGEWRGRLMSNPNLNVVIGAEDNFPGLSQIKKNFEIALGKDFPIYSTLADTVSAAIKKVGL